MFFTDHQSPIQYIIRTSKTIGLVIETNIKDVIVSDFSYNALMSIQLKKIDFTCKQFQLTKCNDKFTHFTENSPTMRDLFLAKKES